MQQKFGMNSREGAVVLAEQNEVRNVDTATATLSQQISRVIKTKTEIAGYSSLFEAMSCLQNTLHAQLTFSHDAQTQHGGVPVSGLLHVTQGHIPSQMYPIHAHTPTISFTYRLHPCVRLSVSK
jgi:hypothetical protein